jgi:hypothetical protein
MHADLEIVLANLVRQGDTALLVGRFTNRAQIRNEIARAWVLISAKR